MKQREIKFRIWAETDDGNELIYLGKSECDNGLWFDAPKHLDKYISLMQFTGLHDKKGNEIYEGDVCKRERHKELYEIVFYKSSWAIKNETEKAIWHQEFCNGAMTDQLEIIGNIYENPDLLNP